MVIDNGSEDETLAVAKGLLDASHHETLLLPFPENRGVAAAYNRGLDEAKYRGIEWMMILDQDTELPGRLVETLMAAADGLMQSKGRIAGVAPMAINGFSPDHHYSPYAWSKNGLAEMDLFSTDHPLVPIDSTITSGTLYHVKALEDIKGFNASYFIDFVDHEAHVRLKQRGWGLWCHKESQIIHYLGAFQTRLPNNGIWVEHAPFRYRYMCKNMLDAHFRLCGMRGRLNLMVQIIRHMTLVIRYAASPASILMHIIKGGSDFIVERCGRIKNRFSCLC